MKRVLCTLMLLATPCWAQTGSNIGLSEYPAPKCEKPKAVDESLRPRTPEDPTEAQANVYNARLRAYNTAIRDFNSRIEVFNTCIQAYMANGNADARRIREALDAAVALANSK